MHQDRLRRALNIRRPLDSDGEARLIVEDNERSITPVIAGLVILRETPPDQGVIRFPSIRLPLADFHERESTIDREIYLSRDENFTVKYKVTLV